MPVQKIPKGYHTITPYMTVEGAAKLIEFLEKAFGATVVAASKSPEGRIMNCELRIGTSMAMVAEAAQNGARVATTYLYVEDTDSVYRKALAAGATSLMEPADQFYGDRNAGVLDPAGNQWWIATRFEDVAPDEVTRRAAAVKRG